MSKELTPLEAFYKLGDNTPVTDGWKIVETALKENEHQKQVIELFKKFLTIDENGVFHNKNEEMSNKECELLKEVLK